MKCLLIAARARDPLASLRVRSALHQLLCRVLLGPVDRQPSPEIVRALARAEEGPANLAALARVAGMSVATFHRRFHAEVGGTPANWLRRRRIRRAKELLLTTSRSVTDIAGALAFPSSQRFATVFRISTGLAPSDYREHAAALTSRTRVY